MSKFSAQECSEWEERHKKVISIMDSMSDDAKENVYKYVENNIVDYFANFPAVIDYAETGKPTQEVLSIIITLSEDCLRQYGYNL